MKEGIVWCPHCSQPHKLSEKRCSNTGAPLDAKMHSLSRVSSKPHPLVGTTIGDGKYRVVRRIGSGGRGEVFEAEQIALGRSVAIKIISGQRDEEAIERLHREASALSSIKHHNICSIVDIGALDDRSPYLVFERLVGETLADRMRDKGRLSTAFAINIFLQVLCGLHAAHLEGILHRDLKPQNVFLVEREGGGAPLVKLLDFGFAMTVFGLSRRLTKPGHACGTPQYMSPEQLRVLPLDVRSDLFSVGVTLFEALTGVHPFRATSVAEIGVKIVREPHPALAKLRPSTSAALRAVVDRALAKDPASRFTSATHMHEALAACVDADEPQPESTNHDFVLPQLASSSSSTPGVPPST